MGNYLIISLYLIITNFGGRVYILYGEYSADAKEQDFGERGYQLRGRHQDVNAVAPFVDNVQTLHRRCQPIIGQHFDLGTQIQPLFALGRTQEATHIVPIIAINLLDFTIAER